MRTTAITLLIALAACVGPSSQQPQSGDALWRSSGHGLLLAQTGDEFEVYEETSVSLLWSDEGHFEDGMMFLDEEPEAEVLVRTNDELAILTVDGTRIEFEQVAALPDAAIVDETEDPEAAFEVFWHTIEEQCSVLSLAGVDWRAAYDRYRPEIGTQTSPERLFQVFGEMIALLNDGHSWVEDSEGDWSADSGPDAEYIWMTERLDEVMAVVERRADGQKLPEKLDGAVRYGTFEQGRYGYLFIESLDGFSDEDSYESAANFARAIDEVLSELSETKALVVDLRANEGGDDNIGLSLVRRMISEPMIAWTKRARIGGYDDFEAPQLRRLEPAGVPYRNKLVLVLTTDANFSAGETLLLALRELPQVVQIGTPTYGIFSNTLHRQLSNGWSVTTSNERYRSVDGIDYEQKGIAPHYRVESSPEFLDRGEDPVLDEALVELERRRKQGTLAFPLHR